MGKVVEIGIANIKGNQIQNVDKVKALKGKKKKWIRGWIIEENKKVVGHIGNFPMNYFLNKKDPYSLFVSKNIKIKRMI